MKFKGHISIEGPIGVGKTALAKELAARFDSTLNLESVEENPFIVNFNQDKNRFAFQTQMFFLMTRFTALQQFSHRDLFHESVISDYSFFKDRIFANLTLSEKELALYNRIAHVFEEQIAPPDIVIFLTASVSNLLKRIKKRDRSYDKIDKNYLSQLSEAYSNYFFNYSSSPLLVIKTDNIDLSADSEKISFIINKILSRPDGTEYISFDYLAIEGK